MTDMSKNNEKYVLVDSSQKVLFQMVVGLDYLELKPTQPKLKLGLGLSLAINMTIHIHEKN